MNSLELATERFRRYVVQSEGCWGWRGPTQQPWGYGIINVQQPGTHHPKHIRAHRFAYEMNHGPIPDGLFVLHTCDNPPCTRPDHLYVGDHKDNMRDMAARGRRLREQCFRGHPFTDDNLHAYWVKGKEFRTCLTCLRDGGREWMRRKRAALPRQPLKITKSQVVEIQSRISPTSRHELLAIAAEFGISERYVRSIVNGTVRG